MLGRFRSRNDETIHKSGKQRTDGVAEVGNAFTLLSWADMEHSGGAGGPGSDGL